jgi:uncharacterized protein YkwD
VRFPECISSKSMKRLTLLLILLLGLAFGAAQFTVRAAAEAYSTYDVIAAVNELRANQGLPALAINNALMNSAQAHSEYQASIGTWTHTGPGGSTPTTRAIANGYGGGATIYISENVAQMLESGTLQTLIYDMWSSTAHWNTMTSSQYVDIGAGVAVSNGRVYYTIDVGVIWGSTNPTQPPTGSQTLPPSTTQSYSATNTPHPDGSVIHEVKSGQTLWLIAQMYNLTVTKIKELNGLTSDTVYVGDRLIIQPSFTPTISPTITLTSLPPTSTPVPTRTLRTPTISPTVTLTPTATPESFQLFSGFNRQTLGTVIIIVSALGVTLLVLGTLLKRRAKK